MEVNNYQPMMGLPCQQYGMMMPQQCGMPVQEQCGMVMPQQYGMAMPQQYEAVSPVQLESMYPQTYHIIQPVVESACNNMHMAKGPMYTPVKEELDAMVDDVYGKVEADVYKACRDSSSREERQFYGSGRRVLRDLIGILLIQRLLGRTPFYGYPTYYNPYMYNYPGVYGPGYGVY
jgi:hypothetical protein